MNNTANTTAAFPAHTRTEDLRAVVAKANGNVASGSISDGRVDEAGFTILRTATGDELDRAARVGLVALAELDARGVALRTIETAWLR
jgi:hypothetical protein